tara:strand:+ start:3251 stop:4027 length:777 start_codon:yes stop_codon:yes gene_type:complete
MNNIKNLNLTQILLIILILFLTYIHFIKKDPVIEGMANVSGVTYEALQTLASMYNSGKLKVSELEVTGPATINGHITCKGGGDFSATGAPKRYLFSDYDSGGKKLRVGNPWGVPGIYAESGNLAIGSKDNNIYCGGENHNHTTSRLFAAELASYKGGVEHAWLGYSDHNRFLKDVRTSRGATLSESSKRPVFKNDIIRLTMSESGNHYNKNYGESNQDRYISVYGSQVNIFDKTEEHIDGGALRANFRIVEAPSFEKA